MIFDDPQAFLGAVRGLPASSPACAKAVFLVSPDGFGLDADSARDNAYMDLSVRIDGELARRQHADLHRALSRHMPTICFAGREDTPEAVFPNNVFATARAADGGRFLIGRMCHPARQREAERKDIQRFFMDTLGLRCIDLRTRPGLSELTGTLVIDRARGFGFAGMSPRCDAEGACSMDEAFGLNATLRIELAAGEYHSNVVFAVLAARALVVSPSGIANPAALDALIAIYRPQVIELDAAEKAAFAGNCIALDPNTVWMSERAADGLRGSSRNAFERAGFRIASVGLSEIEKSGGSLRCCTGEIF